jgi:hypothetical protein
MPPEQISYISDFDNYSDAKAIAIGFLNGLTIDEIDMALEVKDRVQKVEEVISEIIKEKYNNVSDIEENFNIRTDWFKEEVQEK